MNIRSVRTVAAAVGGVLVASAAATAISSPAQAATYVANPSFASNANSWTSSSNATKSRVKVSISGKTKYAGQVKAKSSKASNIRLTSTVSPSTVPAAGTKVHTAVRVKASQAKRNVTYRLDEIYAGKVVSSHQSRTPSKTGWFWVGAELKTKKAGSKIRVYAQLDNVTAGRTLQITDVSVDLTKAPTATPKPSSPTPTPTATPTATPTPATPTTCEDIDYSAPEQGTLTYADEFNGTSLDRTKWRIRDNTFLNQDAAYIDKKNVSVHDGYLDIMGKREPEANWRSNPNSLYGEENRVRKYSTGYVDTIKTAGDGADNKASADRFSQKYGYFEARMWVPSTDKMSQGIWPAFWLRGDKALGEIDVMESYGSPTIRKGFDPSPSYEWNSWEDTSQQSTKNHFLDRPKVTEPIHKTWHTFGVNWSPTCLRYTMDGKTVGVARPIAGEVPYINGKTFDSPFHVRLNMQIGSKYWGWPDTDVTKDEFHFKTDYVRVYQANKPLN